MLTLLARLFILLGACALFTITWFILGPGGVYQPIDHGQERVVRIDKGISQETIGKILLDQGFIKNDCVFYMTLLLSRHYNTLKAGEFLIPQLSSPWDVIQILFHGKGIVHSITFPEGITVSEIIQKVNALEPLKGEISASIEEGTLLPETYAYVYGDTRQSLINRMASAMDKTLQNLWAIHQKMPPLKTLKEVVITASLVEKETRKAEEYPRIAAVFLNRLKKGMKLQSDPTVIYGLTLGKSKLDHPLTKQDLKTETPFNTYQIQGLPPHPICCPGLQALRAVFMPLETEDLFFVANGTGGHTFTQKYQDHLIHVKTLREREKKNHRLLETSTTPKIN